MTRFTKENAELAIQDLRWLTKKLLTVSDLDSLTHKERKLVGSMLVEYNLLTEPKNNEPTCSDCGIVSKTPRCGSCYLEWKKEQRRNKNA